MKRFVVANLSMFDGELKQFIVEAHSAFDAMVEVLGYSENCETEGDIYEYAANTDQYISAIEI